MDFVQWCELVLKACLEASKSSSTARIIGADEFEIAHVLSEALGIDDFRRQPEYHKSTYYAGMYNALDGLRNINLIEDDTSLLWKVTREGREHITDPTLLWWSICQEKLPLEHEQLLKIINQLSPQSATDHVWINEVSREEIISNAETSEENDWIRPVAQDLEQWGLITGDFFLDGGMKLQATYKGLVWETRRGFTLESKFIDDLVAEWETTSVDFKRQFSLDTMDQKAEFIKDILSLVNTKASGQRWLIIGFDDKTHAYFGPPDSKITQNRIEQLLARYTDPYIDVRYEVVEYREGLVGKLEVIRDPNKLPYCVKEKMNREKKQPLMPGDLFVRHGSQVEKPTDAELQSLHEEGNHARLIICKF